MKAILVIDIPKDFENREPYFVEGTLFYHIDNNPYTNYCYAFNIGKTKLKPLPQKKTTDSRKMATTEEVWYNGGFNTCIDEILGDTNNE